MKKLLLLVALLIGTTCFAKLPLPQKNTYVNDLAHLLTKKQVRFINERIRALENKTSAQLAVVLINRLPAEYTIEDYATAIGRKWKVGNNGKGLVYVLSVKDRKQRLEVADGMLKYIPDNEAAEILSWTKIDLKHELYFDAVKTLITQVDGTIASYKADIAAKEADAIREKIEQDSIAKAEVLEKVEREKDADTTFSFILWGLGIWLFFLPALHLLMCIISFIHDLFFPGKHKEGSVSESYLQYRGDGYSPMGARAAASYTTIRRVIHKTVRRPTHTEDTHERPPERPAPKHIEIIEEVEDEKRYGNWGSGNKSSSSGNSGFNGGGATSDW
ncbi:TPM domain-containing protein [Mucilaginibacter daejeonensis]|uniref:TPM domain-containing protein n=1 Tax=Mucilaginibacter daejeonensis TaxID=398049 RepID=UPI001D1771CA|nr:TPM domain-containing protein [Mucilaginibacter daejeonensis]UEG52553.1 TPM domain-containing protein [Mucilaginibacter daejeonensis]